jgi:hypothetical protein
MPYTFKITVTDEEYRAFGLIVPDADEWADHAVRNKIRKCVERVVDATMQDFGLLTDTDRAAVEQTIIAEGDVLKPPKLWSNKTKSEILKKTKMLTRKERDELDANY